MSNNVYIEHHKRRFVKTLDFLGAESYNNILDLSCFPGEFGLLLKIKYPKSDIVLADMEELAIPVAANKVRFVRIGNLNKDKLLFDDDSFDLITNLEVIEHLYHPDILLAEIYRVLKPGGTLIPSTPNLASWINRILLLFGYFPRGMSISVKANLKGASDFLPRSLKESQEQAEFDYHIRLYTFGALKILLREHNFRVLKTKGVYGFKSRQSNLLVKTVHLITESLAPSCAQFILVKAVGDK
ncbi:class I SAM-dependent methyltransferase [Chloroflexota bacterium]